MKYFIILILCLNLTAVASGTVKKTEQKKEQTKPVLVSKTINQDVNESNLKLNAISDSLKKTNAKIVQIRDSVAICNSRIKVLKEDQKGKGEKSSSLSIAFFIVNLFLFLIIATVFYFFYSRLKNRIYSNELRITTHKSSNGQENKEFNKVLNELNMIKAELRQMQFTIDKIQREMKNINQEGKALTIINSPIDNSEPKEVKTEEFFMSTPNTDGSFNQGNSSQIFKATASFYRFTINKTNISKAEFYFVDDEKAVAAASDFPQTYIDPVCDGLNAVNNHAKRIVTVQPGIVEKSGDKWVLIKKAVIRYE